MEPTPEAPRSFGARDEQIEHEGIGPGGSVTIDYTGIGVADVGRSAAFTRHRQPTSSHAASRERRD